jgi:hypothetical protein
MPRPMSMQAYTASHSSKHGDGFMESARLIAGENPPRWLAQHLREWSPSIMIDAAVHARQPRRAEMRARLKRVMASAELLQRELQDAALAEFLQTDDLGPIPNLTSLVVALQDIQRRASVAFSSTSLATKSGKTKSGAGRALPPNASSPAAFCAAVVLEAWAYFHHGEHPAASNLELAAAANEYWRACGGNRLGWGDTRLTGWRPDFEEALKPPLMAIRKELQRHMLLSDPSRTTDTTE